MKDKLHEQLSALVDDELTGAEQDLLTRQIGRDRELCQRLSRYQLISDALQRHLPERVDPAFSRRVHDALRSEPTGTGMAAGGRLARLFRPVAGLAVAASVAVMAVTALQTSRVETPAPEAVATVPADSGFIRSQDSALAVAPETGPRTRNSQLDIYLVNHNEYAASRAMQGMLPYVRIVGHDMKRDVKE